MIGLRTLVRRSAYTSLGAIDALLERKQEGLVALCHHSVSAQAGDDWRFTVSTKEFRSQLQYLAERFHFATAASVEAYLTQGKPCATPAVLVTFDDGYKDLLSLASVLGEYGIKPIVFALSDPDSADREQLGTTKELLSMADLREMVDAGWSIGSHGATHVCFQRLSPSELRREVSDSRMALEQSLGAEVRYFAYPKGACTAEARAMAGKAGYSLAFTMGGGQIERHTDPLLVPRIGVDRTHCLVEFKSLASPLVVGFRRAAKRVTGDR